jgi:glyoxylase-like metal-dependent hydrolase (beta-lactamase superfamily II)
VSTPDLHEVLPGVHRIAHAATCCYLLQRDGRLVLVDAGLPRTRGRIEAALRSLGAGWGDVEAVVLTHAHFDHLGDLGRVQREHDVPVLTALGDVRIAEHPYRYRPGVNRLRFIATHPGGWPYQAQMIANGALKVPGVERVQALPEGPLAVLPDLEVVPTPGHTDGHCALHLRSASAVLTGDALVTLDPYTGRTGPRIVARPGTRRPEQARASLAPIAATGADVVLPGHGEPFLGGAARAAAMAEAEPVG